MGEALVLPDPDRLPDHDQEVLRLLGEEAPAEVTFQGLRRRLGIHQESLTRALRRLEDDELIVRTDEGYRIRTPSLALSRRENRPGTAAGIPLLRTVLPGREAARQASNALRQRWFGNLRWYGQSEDEAGVTLSWVTVDGEVRLNARFEGIFLSIDVRVPDPDRLPEAVPAAHRLLSLAARAYMGSEDPALTALDT